MFYLVLILVLPLIIFLARLINRWIIKDKFIIYDLYRVSRLLVSFMFVFSIFMSIFKGIEWISTNEEVYRGHLLFSLLLNIFLAALVLTLKYLYSNRYKEDFKSFTFDLIFKKYEVSFDNIKRARIRTSRNYGTRLAIETFSGESLELGRGYFNMPLLDAYINLNTDTNIFLKNHYWVELNLKRKSLNPEYASEENELWNKLNGRLNSVFKPRVVKKGNGFEQRPSAAVLVTAILLLLLALGIVTLTVWYLVDVNDLLGNTDVIILSSVIVLLLLYFSIRQFISYINYRYYEDEYRFNLRQFSKNLTMKFADIREVYIKHNRIIFPESFKNQYGINKIKTNNIFPEFLIRYLAANFCIDTVDKDGGFKLIRKYR